MKTTYPYFRDNYKRKNSNLDMPGTALSTEESLVKAAQAVKLKTHKLSYAAREFGIPKGTPSKQFTPLVRKMGPPTVLSAEV